MEDVFKTECVSLYRLAREYAYVGSRIICNPPTVDTDLDILVLVAVENFNKFFNTAVGIGFESPKMEYESLGQFHSMRQGSLNIIICTELDFYAKFLLATKLAKRFNLRAKTDRIMLHHAILYGQDIEAEGVF